MAIVSPGDRKAIRHDLKGIESLSDLMIYRNLEGNDQKRQEVGNIMTKKHLGNACKAAMIFSLSTAMFSLDLQAQEKISPVPNSSPAAEKALSPREELEGKLGKSRKNPPEYVGILSEFINKYPYSERATSYLYSLSRVLKDVKDAGEVRNLLDQLNDDTGQLPAPLKGEIYRRSAEALSGKGDHQAAADFSQKAIALFDDNAYLEFKRKQHEVTMAEIASKNPSFKPRPFDTERTRGFYIGTKTDVYNLLGKSFAEQGNPEAAEKAFRDSFAIKINKNAALGIARAADKNGKDSEALKYATVAALTGKLAPAEMEYFNSIYAKRHQGKTDGVEEYLDTEFRKTYRNPVKSEKYKKTDQRSDRTVLVEFITGAGCIPCIPFDYTFERALEDYSRKEVALIVYHWHAPTMDPLGNHSSDSRVKYYGVNSAPSVFVDGQKISGEDSYYGGDGEQDEIQPIADDVYTKLRNNLELPAEANIELKAMRSGQSVSVNVVVDKLKNVSSDVTLQIALVENETAYSGENGLRFHPMVVRALAGDKEKRIFGFKVDPTELNKFDYVFDVDKIITQNFAYYDTQSSERMAEFIGRMGGKMPEGFDIDFDFNYKRPQIKLDNLSVVAYLQDNKTKKILQSSFVSLASH